MISVRMLVITMQLVWCLIFLNLIMEYKHIQSQESSFESYNWQDKEFCENYSQQLDKMLKNIEMLSLTTLYRSNVEHQVNNLYDKLCNAIHSAAKTCHKENTHKSKSKSKKW